MLKIGDLPAHPLIVHAPVVLVPLVAAGLIAFFALPRWRRPLGLVVAGLAAAAAGAAILAVASGEELGEALERGAELDAHRSFGERARLFTVLLALATGALVLYDRRRPHAERWVRRGTAAVGIVAVAAVGSVFLTGHTGAELAWAQRLPDDDVIAANGATASGAGVGAGAAGVSPVSPSTDASSGASTTHPPSHAASTTPTPSTPTTASPAAEAGETAAGAEVHVVLGEWALVTSAAQAPPGPITFRFHNAGTVPHAFRIRSDDDDSGGDRDEWRSVVVGAGQEATLTADLAAGRYELDCPIEDGHGEHDALGMEAPFSVSPSAPALTAPTTVPPAPATTATTVPGAGAVSTTTRPAADQSAADAATPATVTVPIQGFAFQPAEIRVKAGDRVTWTNQDPTTHDATGDGWSTGPLPAGATATVTFTTPGVYTYRCTIHPSMTGTIYVDP